MQEPENSFFSHIPKSIFHSKNAHFRLKHTQKRTSRTHFIPKTNDSNDSSESNQTI